MLLYLYTYSPSPNLRTNRCVSYIIFRVSFHLTIHMVFIIFRPAICHFPSFYIMPNLIVASCSCRFVEPDWIRLLPNQVHNSMLIWTNFTSLPGYQKSVSRIIFRQQIYPQNIDYMNRWFHDLCWEVSIKAQILAKVVMVGLNWFSCTSPHQKN